MNVRIVCTLMFMLCGLASAQVAPGFTAANQAISQAPGTGLSLSGQTAPGSNLWKITDAASVANNHTWRGNVHLNSTAYNFSYFGQSRDIGAPHVPLSGQGWTVSSGLVFNYTSNLAGIGQLISGNVTKNGAGDFAAMYLYPTWMGGDGAGADEGQNGISLNGGQATAYYRGTVRTTTGTGDTHPALAFTPTTTLPSGQIVNNRNAVSSWNYLIDTADVVLSGNYAGNSKKASLGGKIALLPVSNNVAVDTGRCSFGNPSTISPKTGYPAAGNTTDASPTLNQPVSRTVTCWVMNGLHLSKGYAWIADDDANEQVNIADVTRNANGTDTVTFTAAQAHGLYAVFVQNPKLHGCLRSVTDYNLYQRDDDILVFGAYDPTHLEVVYRQGTQYSADWPFTGDTAAKNTDPYQVHPCAQILAADQDGQLVQLEQNDIPFAVGSTVSSPWPTSTHQAMLILRHNFESPNNRGVPSSVANVNGFGPGFTGRASLLALNSLGPISYFTNAANPLTPPTGIQMLGSFTNNLVLQSPRHSRAPLSPLMCDSTVLCLAYALDPGVTNLCLLNSYSYVLSICQNVAGGYWDFAGINGSDIRASGVRVTGGTSATGSYLRYDGTHYIGSKIQMGDMPAAGITKTITITPTSGTCTLTVQNGLITGTSGC